MNEFSQDVLSKLNSYNVTESIFNEPVKELEELKNTKKTTAYEEPASIGRGGSGNVATARNNYTLAELESRRDLYNFMNENNLF